MVRRHSPLSSSAQAEDPLRRGFSILSRASQEYWVPACARTTPNVRQRSRDALRPRFAGMFLYPLNPEGAGNAGCALHPRSHARSTRKRVRMSIQGQRRTSDIPCAMALRLISCSPRRTAFCLRCALGSRMPPGAWTPASRRQDHTSSPYALAPFVIGTTSVHRDPSQRSWRS